MRVLGVDPGLTRCGLGVIDARMNRKVSFIDVRVARSSAHLPPDQRLLIIANEIDKVIDSFSPDVMAVERVFAQDNVRSVMGTAQVAGIVLLAAARRGIPIEMHTPSEVKASVTGSGRADKKQIQQMVKRILSLDEVPQPADAADALAIAICQAWRGGPASLTAQPDRYQHGGAGLLPPTEGAGLTAAQKIWAKAERKTRSRTGAKIFR
ncbi:MAG: crossover junction endodeoxyribonuclease RuvC [Actinomycetaceae bacterium]|nr:crossover junction endodeoxyribonuclease RuvC [Actinomycetaceae bacterium]